MQCRPRAGSRKSLRENGCLSGIQQHVIVTGLPARSHLDDAYVSVSILTRRRGGPPSPHRAGVAQAGRWHIAPSRTLSMQACPVVGFGRRGLARWGETGRHGHGRATRSGRHISLFGNIRDTRVSKRCGPSRRLAAHPGISLVCSV